MFDVLFSMFTPGVLGLLFNTIPLFIKKIYFDEMHTLAYVMCMKIYFYFINKKIVLKRIPGTPGVNMENNTSNT